MWKKTIKKAFAMLGYDIRRRPKNVKRYHGYVLHEGYGIGGDFNYEHYRKVQSDGNKHKLHEVSVYEKNIAFLADYIRAYMGGARFGICHGTRRGMEQEWFRKYLGCEVIGTEISDTALQFPNTIQWDFHEVKPEWIDSVDFIFSNSFDHSYDPEKCLNAWMSCVRMNGLCILEHSSAHDPSAVTKMDPFGAELGAMPYLVALWGKGRYCVREIVRAPEKKAEWEHLCFIIIQRVQPVKVSEGYRI